MKLRMHHLELTLEFQFTIARGSVSTQPTLIVELEHDGQRGFGEATANAYYGHTLASLSKSIKKCDAIIASFEFGNPADLWKKLQPVLKDDAFALSAIDVAAWDLYGKLEGKKTYELLGLDWQNTPDSSYTIGIDSVDTMTRKLKAHADWPVYKIKLGTDHDVDIIRQLRKSTQAALRVDANCGWSAEETIANSFQLKELGVEFIEQPLPANSPVESLIHVYEQSALPVMADESCLSEPDIATCAGQFHGVNVKLSKCGGITPAVKMLRHARTLGLKTMVGCMVESSVGISGAAQLLPLLDYADLDGAALLAVDPAQGVTVKNGRVALSRENGNGISFPFQRTP